MCTGTVASLVGQTVAFTGKVSVRGQWRKRDDLVDVLLSQGASYKSDTSNKVSLLIHGDLSGQHVVNEWLAFSKKLEFVRSGLASGIHICVVTSRGFSDLLDGQSATCQTSSFQKYRQT